MAVRALKTRDLMKTTGTLQILDGLLILIPPPCGLNR
jgi:hypothetical protein